MLCSKIFPSHIYLLWMGFKLMQCPVRVLVYLLIFAVLDMEPRALCMLGRCSTTEQHPPTHTPIFSLLIYCDPSTFCVLWC
jgi:hypothetical protein